MNRPHVFIGVAATAALLLPRLPFRGPRRARTPIVALMLATVAAAAAATACADIGIVSVAPATSRPGAIVRVRVNGYLPLRAASMPIVLVRAGLIPRPYSCQNKTAICEPIVWRGRLKRTPYHLVGFASRWTRSRSQPDHADSVVRFRIPKIAAGRYRVALWCGSCVRGPEGSLIAGPLLIVRGER